MTEIKKQEVYVGPKKTEIPVDWSLSNLGDLTSNTGQYGANESAVNYEPSKYRYIRVTDMTEDGRLTDKDKKSIDKEGNEKYELEDNDLLFARTGSPGMSYIVDTDDYEGDAVFAGYLIRFDLLEEEIEPKFMRYYLQSYYFWSWINSFKRSTTLSNVNAGEYSTLPIILPTLPEQRRIAEILSTVDEAIQQTDEIIETSKEMKKGLMQDLLTKGIGHDEFKEVQLGPNEYSVPEDWKLRKLEPMINIKSGDYFKKSEFTEEGVNCLKIDNVGYGEVFWETTTYLPENYLEEHPSLVLEEGDIVLALNRPITNGEVKVGRVKESDLPAILYQRVGHITPETEDLREDFLFNFFRSNIFKKQLKNRLVGTDQPYISNKDLHTIRIPIPQSVDEQREIAERLSVVDEKIRQEEEYREELEELKKGLMQDLLTGEVRVSLDG